MALISGCRGRRTWGPCQHRGRDVASGQCRGSGWGGCRPSGAGVGTEDTGRAARPTADPPMPSPRIRPALEGSGPLLPGCHRGQALLGRRRPGSHLLLGRRGAAGPRGSPGLLDWGETLPRQLWGHRRPTPCQGCPKCAGGALTGEAWQAREGAGAMAVAGALAD